MIASLVHHRQCAERRPTVRRGPRRGVAVIVVLGLLTITMALSYAMLRGQQTSIEIQGNVDRAGRARRAAVTGLSVALRRMHENAWAGVGTPLSANISSQDSYQVTYSTGDPRLSAGDADYPLWPYRVTVLSTGTARDLLDSNIASTYAVRAIVQLVPRAKTSVPAGWDTAMGFTAFQTDTGDELEVNPPCQFHGAVRINGQVEIGSEYSWSDTVRDRYLSDLNLMRQNGYPDYRPFSGTVTLKVSSQNSSQYTLLTTRLGTTTVNASSATSLTLPSVSGLSTYRLYTGGQAFNVTSLSSTVSNATLQAAVTTNPLGIFYRDGNLTLQGNVIVTGTLIAKNDITSDAAPLSINPVNLPALEGTTTPIRLPALMANRFETTSSTTAVIVTGTMALFDRFRIERSNSSTYVDVQGHLIASQLSIEERSNWDVAAWGVYYTLFGLQSSQQYFPLYIAGFSMHPQPFINIRPPSTIVTDHIQSLSLPIYIAAPSDEGLYWDVLDWAENL